VFSCLWDIIVDKLEWLTKWEYCTCKHCYVKNYLLCKAGVDGTLFPVLHVYVVVIPV
jgi:hypothetical protein